MDDRAVYGLLMHYSIPIILSSRSCTCEPHLDSSLGPSVIGSFSTKMSSLCSLHESSVINVYFFFCCRREAIQVHLGRLWVAIRAIGWTDTPLSQAHRRQTISMQVLRSLLLPFRSSGVTHETPSSGGIASPSAPSPAKTVLRLLPFFVLCNSLELFTTYTKWYYCHY